MLLGIGTFWTQVFFSLYFAGLWSWIFSLGSVS